MGEQAQENHSSATNLPAWGLKEIADLSVSRALLCWSCGGGWLEWEAIVGGGGYFRGPGTLDMLEWAINSHPSRTAM